jgi:predicted metal-dependent phosphoesterase TrpH
MIIDMHIHTNLSSCSVIGIADLIKSAKALGLDGICITDHDKADAQSMLNNIDLSGLCVIVGMEYTTLEGDFLVFGDYSDLPRHLNAWDLYNHMEKRGGIVIPCHPYRKSRPTNHYVLDRSHIIEVINGRNSHYENELSKRWLLSKGNGTKGIGGSDAHSIHEVGKVVTLFEKNIYRIDDLIRELSSGNYVAVQRTF